MKYRRLSQARSAVFSDFQPDLADEQTPQIGAIASGPAPRAGVRAWVWVRQPKLHDGFANSLFGPIAAQRAGHLETGADFGETCIC